MKWISINIAKHLRSPAAIESTPADIGTWVRVLGYCCAAENGGRIVGGATWKDRQWQKACAVSLRDVCSAERLVKFDGADVVVSGYPQSIEVQVPATGRIRLSDLRQRQSDKDRHLARAKSRDPNSPPLDAESLALAINRCR